VPLALNRPSRFDGISYSRYPAEEGNVTVHVLGVNASKFEDPPSGKCLAFYACNSEGESLFFDSCGKPLLVRFKSVGKTNADGFTIMMFEARTTNGKKLLNYRAHPELISTKSPSARAKRDRKRKPIRRWSDRYTFA